MDRTDFLKLCQKCSILNFKNITDDLLVEHKEIKYIPYGYEMKFVGGNVINNAILKDTKANSITYAKLEQVDKFLNI